jgi:hypothetical protein
MIKANLQQKSVEQDDGAVLPGAGAAVGPEAGGDPG